MKIVEESCIFNTKYKLYGKYLIGCENGTRIRSYYKIRLELYSQGGNNSTSLYLRLFFYKFSKLLYIS